MNVQILEQERGRLLAARWKEENRVSFQFSSLPLFKKSTKKKKVKVKNVTKKNEARDRETELSADAL